MRNSLNRTFILGLTLAACSSSGGVKGSAGSGGHDGGLASTAGSGGETVPSAGPLSSSATETIPGQECTPPAAYANLFISLLGKTQAEVDAKLSAAWSTLFDPKSSGAIYHEGPAADEACVVDTGNNDARTEGMSYGMMIAVQMNRRAEFDRLWTFTKKHMIKGTGSTMSEITWSVSTGGGPNGRAGGAPDGDEYYAAALIFAHRRWGDDGKYNYAAEAQSVLDLVRTKDFNSTYHLVKFWSGGDNGQTDASYMLPAFYQTWACFDGANAAFWNTALSSARRWLQTAMDSGGNYGDQQAYSGSSPANTGVDKIRCVVNIMMDHNFFNADPWQTQTYAPTYAATESKRGSDGAQSFCDALLGFGLPADSGESFVQNLWSADVPNGDYWNGVLYMLAMLHVSGTFRLWY